MNDSAENRSEEDVLRKLREVEERLDRIERALGIGATPQEAPAAPDQMAAEDALEFEIGQYWFAKAGIILLALGVAFLLTFPYHGLPSALPSLTGALIAAAIAALSQLWRKSYSYLSPYLLGGGLVLLYFSVLRLHFFGSDLPVQNQAAENTLLLVVVLFSLVVSARRRSPYLVGLSLSIGYATALVGGPPLFTFAMISGTAAAAVYLQVKEDWQPMAIYAAALAAAAHLAWSVNNPFLGNEPQFVTEPRYGIYAILFYAILFAGGNALRKNRAIESRWAILSSLVASGTFYGLYLLVTAAGFRDSFALSQVIASVLYLGISIMFWLREQSRYSTFFYAMLGYLALSLAIVSYFTPGEAFIWLAWQSLLVISTALWFRSKFIVVTNSVIYMLVLVGSLVWGGEMTPASLSFGVVALVSARIMNAQQHRLELKTEAMRNAYLVAAFLVIPYVLYELVPNQYVSLSWLGVALVYFALNLILKKQKYRWMAISTLILTIGYILIVGIISLEPTYRILSFLALGLVLLAVSMIYARLRARRVKS